MSEPTPAQNQPKTQQATQQRQPQFHLPNQNILQFIQQKKDAKNFNRPTKLIGSPSQQDVTILRSAKSGSIKAKLNLQNTRLRVNIENLNVTLTLKEENEKKMRKQIDRLVDKVKKYKDRAKQKDLIIMKLMRKLEKESQSIVEGFLNEHQQFISQIKEGMKQPNEDTRLCSVITKYQTLYEKSKENQGKRTYIQKENEQLRNIIQNLKDKISTLEKDKQPEIYSQNQALKEEIKSLKHEFEEGEQKRTQKISEEFLSLKENYAQNDDKIINILTKTETNEVQIQEQMNKIGEKLKEIEVKNEEQKKIQTEISKTKDHLTYLTTQYQQETKNWMQIQAQLEEKIRQLTEKNYELEDQNENLERKCEMFSLKIRSYAEGILEEQAEVNPDEQLQMMHNRSSRLRKENLNLNEQLRESQKAYETLLEGKKDEKSGEFDSQENKNAEIQQLRTQIQELTLEIKELKSRNIEKEEQYKVQVNLEGEKDIKGEIGQEKSQKARSDLSAYFIQILSPQLEEEEELQIDELIEKYKDQRQTHERLKINYAELENELNLLKAEQQSNIKQKQESEGSQEYYRQIKKENDVQEQIISQSYQLISEQIERLTEKCTEVEKEKEKMMSEAEVHLEEKENQKAELLQKIERLEEHNVNMANVIMHLEEELSKYREGKESSFSNEGKDERSKKSENLSSDIREQQESEIKKIAAQYEELVGEIGQSNYAYNFKLKNLENQIKELRVSLEEGDSFSKQKEKMLTQSLRKQCKNCTNLTATNKQLLVRIKALQMKGQQELWQNLQPEFEQKQMRYGSVSDLVKMISQKDKEIDRIKEEAKSAVEEEAEANRQLVEKIEKYLREKEKAEKESENWKIRVSQLEEKENELKGLYELISEKDEIISQTKLQVDEERNQHQEKSNSMAQLIEENQQLNKRLIDVVDGYDKLQTFFNEVDANAQRLGYEGVEDLLQKMPNIIFVNNQIVTQNDELKESIKSKQEEVHKLEKEKEYIIGENNKILESLQELQNKIKPETHFDNSPQKSKDATVEHSEARVSPVTYANQIAEMERANEEISQKNKILEEYVIELENREKQNVKMIEDNEESRRTLLEEILRLISCVNCLNDQSQPDFSIQKLDNHSEFCDLITLLKVKLQIYWSIALEKTNKMNEIFQQMKTISMECIKEGTSPKVENQQPSETEEKLQQAAIIEQRYEELLTQLMTYEDLNKNFYNKLMAIREQTNNYKQEIESNEDFPYNEEMLHKLIDESSGEANKGLHPLLKLCLNRIADLEKNLDILQFDFDKQNQKLDSLLKKEISFHSEKRKSGENSLMDDSKREVMIEQIEQQNRKKPRKYTDERSFTSVKIFKEIEELTKFNQQLKEKIHGYKNLIEQTSKMLVQVRKSTQEEQVSNSLQKIIKGLLQEFEEGEFKKQSSIFDLEEDYIVSGSFKQKVKKMEQIQDIQVTFEANKIQIGIQTEKPAISEPENANQREEKKEKEKQKNMNFLIQHKVFMDTFVEKIHQQEEYSALDEEKIYAALADNLTEEEIQKIIFMDEPSEAVQKIISLLQANSNTSKQLSSSTLLNKQIEQIINSIYPEKTYLCDLMHSCIIKLMSAESNEEFLDNVQRFFVLLLEEENKTLKLIHRKDECIRDYGAKMQKVLMNKFPDDSGTDMSDLLLENSFKKGAEFQSENEVKDQKKEEERFIEREEDLEKVEEQKKEQKIISEEEIDL